MNGFLWLVTEMLLLLLAAAAVFFMLGWRWRGSRARVQVVGLEKRLDDEAVAAKLAREERDAAQSAQPVAGALETELKESQARQLALERELLRLRDERLAAVRELETAKEDDLTRIRGIGPVLRERLKEAGIRTYSQLAGLDAAALADLDARLNLRGRMTRDGWQEQAGRLHAEKYGEASA